MRFWLTICALVFFIPGAAILTWNVSCEPYEAAADKHASPGNSIPSSVPNQQRNPAADHQSGPVKDAPRWCAAIERPDWWTLLIVALTGIAIAYQAREMTNTLHAVERQADLMNDQLTEMRNARAQATDHLSLTERPWISLEMQPGSSVSFDDRGMIVSFSVKLANVGKSPAKVVALICRVELVPEGEVPERYRNQFIELCRRHWQAETQFVIFPGEEHTVPNSHIVGPSGLHLIGGRLYPDLFVSLSYRSTINPDSRPFSFYTYMIRTARKLIRLDWRLEWNVRPVPFA